MSRCIVTFQPSGVSRCIVKFKGSGSHAESRYSRVLGVTLYHDIKVFWDVTMYRESSLLGCHAGSCNWTQCVYWTVRTISFKQTELSLVLKPMWDFWWKNGHCDEPFSEDFGFPLSTTMLHTHLHAPVTRRAISKAWGPSKNNALWEIRK